MAKGKQEMIPGTETKKDKQIHALAMKFADLRDEWMEKGVEMREASGKLQAAMKAKNIPVYEVGDVSAKIVEGKDKVKVRIASDDPPEE